MDTSNTPSTILIDGVPVEGVEEFIYLGSKQSSNGYSQPDVLRRIGLACSVMNSLQRVWKCSSLNIHLYQALVMSVLLYGAETWTLLAADMKTQPINVNCSVPQGSVFGPVEFIAYTEDVTTVFSKHRVRHHLYADDKQAYVDYYYFYYYKCTD